MGMTTDTLPVLSDEAIQSALDAHPDGSKATAAKRGRSKARPYVPVIQNPNGTTTQLLARAFQTRQEAVDFAAAHLARAEARLREQLARPNYRALREQYGLPRDIAGCFVLPSTAALMAAQEAQVDPERLERALFQGETVETKRAWYRLTDDGTVWVRPKPEEV